jgi:hypothetical protein
VGVFLPPLSWFLYRWDKGWVSIFCTWIFVFYWTTYWSECSFSNTFVKNQLATVHDLTSQVSLLLVYVSFYANIMQFGFVWLKFLKSGIEILPVWLFCPGLLWLFNILYASIRILGFFS